MTNDQLWLAIGFIGQAIFSSRFLVQWIYSESRKRSVIPVSFWYLSLAGSVFLLSYAIYRRDPVFIFGQASGFVIYVRNLQLIARQSKPDETHAAQAGGLENGASAAGGQAA